MGTAMENASCKIRPPSVQGLHHDGLGSDSETDVEKLNFVAVCARSTGASGHSSAPALFEALLDSASEKASTLEQHNTSLGGHGIRQRRLVGGEGPRAARKWTVCHKSC